MSKIYLYYPSAKQYIGYDNVEIIDTTEMSVIENSYKDALSKGYGKIVINEDTMKPEYVENKCIIMVDLSTNDFTKVSTKIEDDEYFIYREISLKDYMENYNKDKSYYMVKYFRDEFHTFILDKVKVYNPADNSYNVDIEKYKEKLIKLVAEDDFVYKNHGFYYSVFPDGETYLQPFRSSPDNDLLTIKVLKEDTPEEMIQLKLFKEDPDTGLRLTRSGEYAWLPSTDCDKDFLSGLIQMITVYSSFLKDGILGVQQKIQAETSLPALEYIEKNYVRIVMRCMQDELEKHPAVKKQIEPLKAKLAHLNIIPKQNQNIKLTQTESEEEEE